MHAGQHRPPDFTFRRLAAADVEHYRRLRLEGLRSYPEAFAASFEAEASRPLDWFVERLERNVVFGGWQGVSALVGILGLHIPDAAKSRHKGELWGMFVAAEAQGTGLATALLARVIEYAETAVEEIRLTVVTTNKAAVRLYANAGFRRFGLERRALKVDGRYYDELLMALPLRAVR